MRDKRTWLRRGADSIRRALVLEPRGHADMVAAALTDAFPPEAHAGILFMDGDGYPAISGHGLIAAATIAVARDLFVSRDADADVRIVFDTPAGVVHTIVRAEGHGAE